MTNLNYTPFASLFVSLLIFFSACKSSGGEVPNDLADLLKRNAVKEYKTDFSYETPEIPDKKYLSLTVVHSFSSADGEPQKEHLGYILKKENGEWKVEKNTSYTLKADKAKGLLRGEK